MEDLNYSDYPNFSEKGPTACSQHDPDLFFPDTEGPNFYTLIRNAKEVCFTCPYQLECLEHAVKNNEPGIWGGTSDKERKNMKRSGRVAIPLGGPVYSGGARPKPSK
jgi:WhiB family redox-sensing transcriptional regulator